MHLSLRRLVAPCVPVLVLCALAGWSEGCAGLRGWGRSPASAPALPESVPIKTGRLTFNSFFYFALDDDGRIWAKPIATRDETRGFQPGWQLFLGGLPNDPDKRDFARPARIISIHGDADELMAVSDEHRNYSIRWLSNPVFPGSPRKWTDVHGWPAEGPYVWNERVRENRGWGIGRRNQIVKFFEDIDGKSFDGGGGLTTYYYLSKDGTEIDFADSGLPPDFSHTMCGPRRSTFVAEGFDVSASTMFVIGRRGEMFTRMADFDTIGSDIMFFEYTYDRNNRKKGLISIPAEDWLEHSRIPLAGQARISSQITIALTGTRNQGRELRVAGTDSEGRAGYYRKPIFVQAEGSPARQEVREWSFQPVPGLAIDPARLLDPAETANPDPAPGAPSRDIAYQGQLWLDGAAVPVGVELSDFNIECSPARLRLSAGGDHVDLTLHTVEEWYSLTRFDPGRDGTPKRLLGTLEIPRDARETRNPQLRQAIETYFAPYHLKDFAFWLEATTEYVSVDVRERPRGAPPIRLGFVRQGSGYASLEVAQRDSLHRDGFQELASSAKLQVGKPVRELTREDLPLLADRIRMNEELQTEMRELLLSPDRQADQMSFVASSRGFNTLRVIGAILGGANLWAPFWSTLTTTMPSLIARNEELKRTLMLYSYEDYRRALDLVMARVEAYKLRQAELEGRVAQAPWRFEETAPAAWSAFRFGERDATIEDSRDSAVARLGCRATIEDSGLSSAEETQVVAYHRAARGMTLTLLCPKAQGGDAKLVFRLSPTRLTRDLLESTLHGARLEATTTVSLEYFEDSPATRAMLEAFFTTYAERKSQEGRTRLRIEGSSYLIPYGSLRIGWKR